MKIAMLLASAVAAFAGSVSAGTVRNLASVSDGFGTMSTNTVALGGRAWHHAGSGAQPGGVFAAAAGTLTNRPGFLQTAWVLRPGADADGDGVPDELETDNDADTLDDVAEVSGSAFQGHAMTDPNVADSDGDGMSDAAEAAGMYDPWDPDHRLAILSLVDAAGLRTLRWVGKGGGATNVVEQTADLAGAGFTNELHRATFRGGTAPWYKATNEAVWSAASAPCLFLRVRTDP